MPWTVRKGSGTKCPWEIVKKVASGRVKRVGCSQSRSMAQSSVRAREAAIHSKGRR